MIRIILVCILLVILLVSCVPPEGPSQVEVGHGVYLTEIDGMPCAIYKGYKKGGITCDWTKYTGTE